MLLSQRKNKYHFLIFIVGNYCKESGISSKTGFKPSRHLELVGLKRTEMLQLTYFKLIFSKLILPCFSGRFFNFDNI